MTELSSRDSKTLLGILVACAVLLILCGLIPSFCGCNFTSVNESFHQNHTGDASANTGLKDEETKNDALVVSDGVHPGPLDCPDVELAYGEAFPVTALAGLPADAVTCVRRMLQTATGIYIGSLPQKGKSFSEFPSDGIHNASVLAVVTSYFPRVVLENPDRAILITEEPFGAIVADMKSRYGEAYQAHLVKDEGYDATLSLHKWYFVTWAWVMDFHGPLHVVWYDDLVYNPLDVLTRLARFLGQEVTSQGMLCARAQACLREPHAQNNQSAGIFSADLLNTKELYQRRIGTHFTDRLKRGYVTSY